MTSAVLKHIPFQTCQAYVNEWTASRPKIALITAIACTILGIASTGAAVSLNLIPAATVALVLSAIVTFCISIALFVSYAKRSSVDMQLTHEHLTQVMQHTLADLKKGQYTSPNGQVHALNMQPAIEGTQCVATAGNVGRRPGIFPTRITVVSQDCLQVAQDLHVRGLNPCVADFANSTHAGGGYLYGARAQEEHICRCSGLSVVIDPRHGMQTHNFYPLNESTPAAGLYVPQVPVFHAGKTFEYLNQPFPIAVAVLAAPYKPSLQSVSGRLRLNDQDAHLVRERIRTMLEMAFINGHRSVVLGAFGCGAFANPPEHIAAIFNDIIQSDYPGCFEEIVFAVLDDHNTGKEHNPEGNFAPFKRQFPN